MLFFSRDLGIDLGTSNVLIYAAGRGIVLREPSVIALDKNSGKVLQVGAAARSMLGRTPGNVVAVHPLQDGVISDHELTARMLTEMLRRELRHAIVKPRMIVTVPSASRRSRSAPSFRLPWRQAPAASTSSKRRWLLPSVRSSISPPPRGAWSSISAAARRISAY